MTSDERGRATFSLPASASGYSMEFVPTEGELKLLTMSRKDSDPVSVPAGSKKEVSVGLRYKNAMFGESCLRFGEALSSPPGDALTLASRLRRGTETVLPEKREGVLATRRGFFSMAATMLCLEHRTNVGKRSLPPDVRSVEDRSLIGDFMRASLPVTRATVKGKAFANLDAPIRREEARLLLLAMVGDSRKPEPEFLAELNSSAGLTWEEAARFIALSAFLKGTIPLEASPPKSGKPLPSFLPKTLSWKSERPCFRSDAVRRASLEFWDVFPGDSMFDSVRALVTYGLSREDRTMWLLPGTERLAEYGVLRGKPLLRLDAPVSSPEVLRSLLLLSCAPPPTATNVRLERDSQAGTRSAWAERDQIASVPRNATLTSRIHFRAQDHETVFDLSLLSFAEHFLRAGPRKIGTPLTIGEASDVFASALLFASVREGRMTREKAENMAHDVAESIRTRLLSSGAGRKSGDSLLRRDLTLFLASTVSIPSDLGHEKLGELWYRRVERGM